MSALTIQENEAVISELPKPKGPGARLKAARLSKKMELDIVAAQLHLSHDMIVALEADDYDFFPARVFVAGYLKNYARHVGLPVEAIIQAFNNYLPADELQTELPRINKDSREVFESSAYSNPSGNAFSWLMPTILIIAIGSFFYWQKDILDKPGAFLPAGWLDTQTDSRQTVEQSFPGQAGSILIPALPNGQNRLAVDVDNKSDDFAAVSRDSSLRDPGQVLPRAVSEANLTDNALQVDTDVQPGEKPVSSKVTDILTDNGIVTAGQTETVATAEVIPAAGDEIAAVNPVAPGVPEIIVSFSQDCWVDIRDSAGTFKYMRVAKAGTSKKITGKPPYKVLLGNVSGATMTIDGEPFDIQRYNQANVARFSLDPSAL